MTQTLTERCDEIDHAKRQVEACIEDYRQSLLSYTEWMAAWRERQQKLDRV